MGPPSRRKFKKAIVSYSDLKAVNPEQTTVVLLAPDRACEERLLVALSSRYQPNPYMVEVAIGAGPPEQALEIARKHYGGIPLGYVAQDEESALKALSSGADESFVWPPRDDQAIRGFFDRTVLRAQLRKASEDSRISLAQAEKLTALGTLVAGVAHEVNNPLTALQLSVESLNIGLASFGELTDKISKLSARDWRASRAQLQELSDLVERLGSLRDVKELLEEIVFASTAIANVVKDLRVFARADSAEDEIRLVETNDVVDQALRLVWRELAQIANIERDYEAELPALAVSPNRLVQVLINVLINAAQAMREVERPAHRLRISTRADDDCIAICVSDTGPGIPADGLEHIFDPFFTTKRADMGTGLGLSISRSIMLNMGGDLLVESVHGTGATFVVLLPIPDKETMRAAFLNTSRISNPPPSIRRTSVLLIDDDQRVLKAYARLLGRTCNIITASDGQEAIDLLSSGSSADAVITELNLPEVDGESFYRWAAKENPRLAARTVFVAADATRERYSSFVRELKNPVLTKPVNASALLEALEKAVNV